MTGRLSTTEFSTTTAATPGTKVRFYVSAKQGCRLGFCRRSRPLCNKIAIHVNPTHNNSIFGGHGTVVHFLHGGSHRGHAGVGPSLRFSVGALYRLFITLAGWHSRRSLGVAVFCPAGCPSKPRLLLTFIRVFLPGRAWTTST